jgi:hypothetical protein
MTKVKIRSSKCSQRQSWMTVSNLEIDTNKHVKLNFAFANHREEDEIYPLTTIEIAEAQHKDQELKAYYKKNAIIPKKNVCLQLVEDTKVLCKNGELIIPASLQHMVPPLPLTPWSLTYQRDIEICDVLERYAYYHPKIRQILQILPG